MKTLDDAIRDRLKRLLRDHNQAKLARATGRSRNALTRYVQGAKLPMSFGAALVEELGVNPAWLLRGDEPMYLSDVPAAAGDFGGELLELMRAMDQVAGLKLGALAGHRHARTLRELSETLDRYGSLRDRLNRISAPVLAELLSQAEQANDRRQLDRASALIKTAFRVQQFCDDRELGERLIAAQAVLRQIEQHSEEALRLQMRIFQSRLALDADFDHVANAAAGLAQVLRSNYYAARAQRVARMGLAFAGPGDEDKPNWRMLQGQHAMTCVELGQYAGVAETLQHALTHSGPGERPLLDAARTFHDLNHGVWSAREIAGGRPTSFAAAAMVLNAGYCTDEVEVIEAALARARELMQPQMPLNRGIVDRGERVLKTLRTRKLAAPRERTTHGDIAMEFTAAVYHAQLLRLAGDKHAPQEIARAQQCLDQYPAERTPNPFQLGLHLRNVLAGIAPNTRDKKQRELRSQATDIARTRITQGHGLLESVLKTEAAAQ